VKRALSGALALLSVACLSGCHVYIPTELQAVPPGQEVRLYLTRAAVASLPEEVPVNEALFLGGRLESQAGDSVVLGIRMGRPVPGLVGQDLRQMVRVGTGQIVDVRRRELSKPRTALAVGGGALAAGLIIGLIFGAEDATDVGDPNDDVSRVPPLSIPFWRPGIGP
jgi:hypothetical protein